jgi:hypothetical protein
MASVAADQVFDDDDEDEIVTEITPEPRRVEPEKPAVQTPPPPQQQQQQQMAVALPPQQQQQLAAQQQAQQQMARAKEALRAAHAQKKKLEEDNAVLRENLEKAIAAGANARRSLQAAESEYQRGAPRAGVSAHSQCGLCRSPVLAQQAYFVMSCPDSHCYHAVCAVDMLRNFEHRCVVCVKSGVPAPTIDFGDSITTQQAVEQQQQEIANYRAHCLAQLSSETQRLRATAAGDTTGGGIFARVFHITSQLWGVTRAKQQERFNVEHSGIRDQGTIDKMLAVQDATRCNPYEALRLQTPVDQLVCARPNPVLMQLDRRITVVALLDFGYMPRAWRLMGLTEQNLTNMELDARALRVPGVVAQLHEHYAFDYKTVYERCRGVFNDFASLGMSAALLRSMGASFRALADIGMRKHHMISRHMLRFSIDEWVGMLGLDASCIEFMREKLAVTAEDAVHMAWDAIAFKEIAGEIPAKYFPSEAPAAPQNPQPQQQQQRHQPPSSPIPAAAAAPRRYFASGPAVQKRAPPAVSRSTQPPSPPVSAGAPATSPPVRRKAGNEVAMLRGRRLHFS